jgi:hypothetical protein
MEKVYADNSLGITKGAFPKPGFKINKRYGCRTRLPVRDTTFTTVPDSLSPAEIPDEGI